MTRISPAPPLHRPREIAQDPPPRLPANVQQQRSWSRSPNNELSGSASGESPSSSDQWSPSSSGELSSTDGLPPLPRNMSPPGSVDERQLPPPPAAPVEEQEPGERTWVHGYYGQEPPESRLDEHQPPGLVVDEQAPPPEVLMDGQEPPVDEEPRQKEWGEQPIRQTINRTNVYQPQMYVRFTPNSVGIGSWINLAPTPLTGPIRRPDTKGSLSTGLMCGAGALLMAVGGFGIVAVAVGLPTGATLIGLAVAFPVALTSGAILCGLGCYRRWS
jgi:hypothetical protein